MIRLTKGAKPDILAEKEGEWTAAYIEALDKGNPPPDNVKDKYRHPQIKRALIEEVHGKCAYCESKVTHVYPGDVEHIVPKSERSELTFSWHNLTFACSRCNNAKRSYYNEQNPLVNPYTDEPKQHVLALGYWLFHVPGSTMGEITIRRLKLNRAELLERREERLTSITRLADKCAKLEPGPLKDLLVQELHEEALCDKEYSAFVRAYLSNCGID